MPYLSSGCFSKRNNWYLVGYFNTAHGKLANVFDEIFQLPSLEIQLALPIEAGPFTAQEAQEIDDSIEKSTGWYSGFISWQPSVDELPSFSVLDALNLGWQWEKDRIAKSPGIVQVDPFEDTTQLQAYALPRSWAVLLFTQIGIGGGWGFLVDRHSRTIIQRQWNILVPALSNLGFNTPIPSRGEAGE